MKRNESDAVDHYEVLQVSPRADQDTIQRVFRHLAKRLHPDNTESGDGVRFAQVMQAFQVLSDPGRRAQYDARYEQQREAPVADLRSEHRARRSRGRPPDPDRHPVAPLHRAAERRRAARDRVARAGTADRLSGTAHEVSLWYLRENGWVERLDNGTMAITASGVDRVLDLGGPLRDSTPLLEPGDGNATGSPPA